MPNLAWKLDEREIRIALRIEQVTLINDLAAHAHGMLTLPHRQLIVINPGVPDAHTGQYSEPAYVTSHILEATDRAAAITQAAQKGESHRCIEVLDIFLHNYGAAAGNLALKTLATGGLFIGGGIAPKLAQHVNKGGFMRAFSNKGRFSEMMVRVPVKLILEPKTALLGAAVYVTKTSSH